MIGSNLGIGRSIKEMNAYCIKHDKHIVVGKGVQKGYLSNKADALLDGE